MRNRNRIATVAQWTIVGTVIGTVIAFLANHSVLAEESKNAVEQAAPPPTLWRFNSIEVPIVPPVVDASNRRRTVIASNGKLLATSGLGGPIEILRGSDGALIRTLERPAPQGLVYELATSSRDEIAVALGNGPGKFIVAIYRLETGQLKQRLDLGDEIPAFVAFSPNGTLLSVAGSKFSRGREINGHARVFDVASGRSVADLGPANGLTQLLFSGDNQTLTKMNCRPADRRFTSNDLMRVVWNKTCEYLRWQTRDWQPIAGSQGGFDAVEFVKLINLPQGKQVALVGRDKNLELYELRNEGIVWSAPLVKSPEIAVGEALQQTSQLEIAAVSADGKLVVTYETPSVKMPLPSSREQLVKHGVLQVRRMSDGAVLKTYTGTAVTDALISPDNKYFVFSTGTFKTFVAAVAL